MRKIINGKLYDTEKATLICEYCDEWNGEILHLYRTAKGTYFIYGFEIDVVLKCKLPDFSYLCMGESWQGDDNVYVIPKEDAIEITEAIGTIDEYIKEFGKPEEG